MSLPDLPRLNLYGGLFLVGILLTAWLWGRLTRGATHDGRLTWIYFLGLFGALIGAKLSFLLAEGWFYRNDLIALLSGRSITGGLLGGYLGVEIGKRWLQYRPATGDVFAVIVPIGLALGRVGCWHQGCCPGVACEPHFWTLADSAGVSRWPAAPLELAFNLGFLAWVGWRGAPDGRRGISFTPIWRPTGRFDSHTSSHASISGSGARGPVTMSWRWD